MNRALLGRWPSTFRSMITAKIHAKCFVRSLLGCVTVSVGLFAAPLSSTQVAESPAATEPQDTFRVEENPLRGYAVVVSETNGTITLRQIQGKPSRLNPAPLWLESGYSGAQLVKIQGVPVRGLVPDKWLKQIMNAGNPVPVTLQTRSGKVVETQAYTRAGEYKPPTPGPENQNR